MSERLTDEELNAIQLRCDAATPGPCDRINEFGADWDNVPRYCVDANNKAVAYCYGVNNYADVRFIGHAFADLPRLLAEVRRLRARDISDADRLSINATVADLGIVERAQADCVFPDAGWRAREAYIRSLHARIRQLLRLPEVPEQPHE